MAQKGIKSTHNTMPFAPFVANIAPSSRARSPERSVLAPFVAMPFAPFVAPNVGHKQV